MENVKMAAFPTVTNPEHYDLRHEMPGFTKLEYASLMIAQGVLSHGWPMQSSIDSLAAYSVGIAKSVLGEANK